MSLLSIITVGYNNIDEVEKTCNSIDLFLDYNDRSDIEHILIYTYTTRNNEPKLLKNEPNFRKWICNEDNGLYDAMNIGIKRSCGEYIYFLNSGDIIFPELKFGKLKDYLTKGYEVLLFQTIQKYKNDNYLRFPEEKLKSLLKRPAHQGFIASKCLIKEFNLYFSLEHKISADTHWMKKLILRGQGVVIPEILSIFELGGISNNPSLKSVLIRFRSNGIIDGYKEVLKYLIKLILGKKKYYHLLATKAGYFKINSDEEVLP
jgi:glycosyltransferase involved in cell wall biosynthesis